MKLSQVGVDVGLFQTLPLKYQQTFSTPLKDLHRFVATILSQSRLEQGILTVELVVFEPKNLLNLLGRHSLSPESVPAEYSMHVTIAASGQEEIAELLEAALGDSLDFVFVPTPESFAIYADHDEYTTFFANKEADLLLVTSALEINGFRAIADYTRKL